MRLFRKRKRRLVLDLKFAEKKDWNKENRDSLNAFLESPSGKALLGKLTNEVILFSMKINPLSEREDGIRQGIAATINMMHELGEKEAPEQQGLIDSYNLYSDRTKQ